ncbi:MAG TPA: hypothetical protein VF875_17355 [Anaeromyxobacter sp.]
MVFSEDHYDLDAKIEPWPHRFVMGTAQGELVAVVGLYVRNTYVERFGLVTDEDVLAVLREGGIDGPYQPLHRREVTKLVVTPALRHGRLSKLVTGLAFSRAFACVDAEGPTVVTLCSVRTIRGFVERLGIRTRYLKPFPHYKIHEKYRSESNPMDSYFVLPDLDVPPFLRDLAIPGEYDLDALAELG